MALISKSLKRSPIWPALLSALVLPGLGQIANRDIRKGIFLMVSSLLSFLWFSKVITEQLSTLLVGPPEQWAQNQEAFRAALMKLIEQNYSMFMTFQILILVIWTFGVVDAYMVGRKIQRRLSSQTNENPNPLG